MDSPQLSKTKGDIRKILESWATNRLAGTLESALVEYVDMGTIPANKEPS